MQQPKYKIGDTAYFLQDQVCSLELAKKIKKLGVKQESLFTWVTALGNVSLQLSDEFRDSLYPRSCFEGLSELAMCKNYYSAFTVAELGEMLPNFVSISLCGGGRTGERVDYVVCSNVNTREAWIAKHTSEINFHEIRSETMADAMAKMLIYLIENSSIKLS